jgi:BRCA1-associated protein
VRDGGVGPGPADALAAEKMEAIGIEYSYLLTSQLDSQRSYYEEQVGGLEGRLTELSGVVERLERELKERRKADEDVDLEKRQREKEEMEVLAREKAKADGRLVKMTEMARRLDKELKEERAVSAGLMKNLTLAKEKNNAREQEQEEWKGKVQDLEDQLRDVMFFLEANAKIEQGGGAASEAAGGSIEMPPPPPPPVPKTGGRKRGKK